MTDLEKMARAYWAQWAKETAAVVPEWEWVPEWDALSDDGKAAAIRCLQAALDALMEPNKGLINFLLAHTDCESAEECREFWQSAMRHIKEGR